MVVPAGGVVLAESADVRSRFVAANAVPPNPVVNASATKMLSFNVFRLRIVLLPVEDPARVMGMVTTEGIPLVM